MKPLLSIFAAAGFALSLHVGPAQAIEILYSRNFYAAGTCDGQDVVPLSHQFTPWETVPITIVGLQVTLRPNSPMAPATYFFAGNSYSPDIMGWGEILSNGSGMLNVWYPPGMGFPFPGPSANPPHIDLHVACAPVGVGWQAFYTVFYTREPAL